MALDEPKETDEKFEISDFTFVIDKELLEQGKPFKVDMSYLGFQVDSSMELGGGGCSSSGGCSSGGCAC